MRIILTEDQYRLIEKIIEEAVVPFSKKIEKGGYIKVINLVGDKEVTNTLQVAEIYGGGKYVQGRSKGTDYMINVTGSLDEDANTFTVMKDAEYQEGQKTAGGKLTAPKVVGGSKMVIKNVLQVIVIDNAKNEVDNIYTKLGEEHSDTDFGDEEEMEKQLQRKAERAAEKKSREKRVLDLVMSDPTLKKAFYAQPTLLRGLIKYGGAKGIGPAQALIDKYTKGVKDKETDDKTKTKDKWSEFKVNKSVMFEVAGKPIRVSYGDEDFNLMVGKNYKARYKGKGYMSGKYTKDIHYKIYMKENLGGDIYRGTIKVYFTEEDGSLVDKMSNIVVRIKDYNY